MKCQIPWIKSLGFTLIIWFIVLSIIPLSVSEYSNYLDRVSQLEIKYKKDLKSAALSDEIFIKNWFKYRKSDIKMWSQLQNNINLLISLEKANKNFANTKAFLESYDYALITDEYEGDLFRLRKEYDYIYDILFIDLSGNVLFSLKKEDDLGSNLFNGALSSTKFASAVSKTIETGGIHFSDLEFYQPSNNLLAGFISAPIINNNGDLKGVMSIQIDVEKMKGALNLKSYGHFHYFVGEDNLLRSDVSSDKKALTTKVSNTYIEHWMKNHHTHSNKEEKEKFIHYINPSGHSVMGIHNPIHLLGVNWMLVSEVAHELIFADKIEILKKFLFFFFIIIVAVTLAAIYLSKVITKPIIDLKEASVLFTKGSRDTSIIGNYEGEVGELAKAFKDMLLALNNKESELKKFSNELEERVKQQVSITVMKEKELQRQSQLAQEKLNKSFTKFSENVISSSSDTKGIITFASKALCDISGYTADELIGKPHSILRHPDMPSKVFEELWKTIKSGKPWEGEIKNKTKNGEFYWVRSSIIPDFDDNNTIIGYSSIRHDITSQKAKEQFMANMSHELRTPLNAIIGFGSILAEQLQDADNLKFIKIINSSANALLSLVNDILDLSKIRDSKFTINPYEFNAYQEINDNLEQFKGLTAQKNLTLHWEVDENLKAVFFGDWIRISQISLNLISNAIKFTPKGGEISYRVFYEENALKLLVNDNGIGMTPEVQDRVFKPFEQADGSTTREYGGTGLGLTIVQNLVELMKGTIELESQAGVGTTFKITIPLKKVETTLAPIKHPILADDKDKVLLNAHVLAVDDDEFNQLLLEVYLADIGITLDIVKDGLEAVEVYDPEVHRLILMDENMPNLNGVEAMKRIRSKYKDKCGPIIALTANAMKGDKQRFLDLGMDGYIAKPIDKHELFETIKNTLLK